MKRTNVVLDEELLEKARRVSGEKTYSATITKALEEIVKRDRFREALKRFQDAANQGGMFVPGHLEDVRPPEYSMDYVPPKRRGSADEVRAPRSKSRRRASR